MRRLLLKSLALVPWATDYVIQSAAAAENPFSDELTQPYRMAQQILPADARIVRLFFAFSCVHCASHHVSIERWGRTLPASLRWVPTPLVAESDGYILGAHAYYAAFFTDHGKLAEFVRQTYQLIHQSGRSAGDARMYLQAAAQAGIATTPFKRRMADASVRKIVLEAASLVPRYGVISTPTLAIGGKYLITPEIVNGEPGMFFNLANAMVSRHLQEG